mgnify:FL=1
MLSTLNLDHFLAAFDFNAWSVDNLIDNAGKTAKRWISGIIIIIGVIIFLISAWFVLKIFTTQQGRGGHAMWAILGCAAGGLLMYGGFSTLNTMGKGLSQSVKDLGKG